VILCERCGTENVDTAAVCAKCRRPLTTAASQQLPVLRAILEEQQKQSKSLSRIELLVTVFAVLVFIDLLLLGMMAFGLID
jgi:uncharacterized membrane protein YvbJ